MHKKKLLRHHGYEQGVIIAKTSYNLESEWAVEEFVQNTKKQKLIQKMVECIYLATRDVPNAKISLNGIAIIVHVVEPTLEQNQGARHIEKGLLKDSNPLVQKNNFRTTLGQSQLI